MTRVWIYENGNTIRKFKSEDEANEWFKVHDPEDVAFAYEEGELILPVARMNMVCRLRRN